jgi:hypothetical protein
MGISKKVGGVIIFDHEEEKKGAFLPSVRACGLTLSYHRAILTAWAVALFAPPDA